MRKGENPSRVLEALKEKIDSSTRTCCRKGVQIVPYYDRSWLIDTHAAHGLHATSPKARCW